MMTTISANAFVSTSSSLATASAGAQLSLAAGILGRALNPLNAGPLAVGTLPSLWAIAAFSRGAPEPAAQWTATTGAEGRASIDLGDGYTMELNENNSEIVINNANTGETTQIWGDPHVNVDGKHAFDFWGTTTFTLENGTKITIGTEAGKTNPDVFYASNVTITKGDQAIVVDGISQQEKGDLSISMGGNGRAIDAATRDGFVLNENANGAGWTSMLTGDVATQADLNATKPGAAYGPGSGMPSVDELSSTLSSFLVFGLFAAAVADLGSASSASQSHNTAALFARAFLAV
ncbi:DUF1521 domain-containing protein [Sphingomonas sp. AP4-R1]|uniref:DUF1521 domain-containing protein n=1 Tax=Sphingomonas sp. AP4-R1 TaxID=2735134 RepID=UPI00149391F5|nr:DUF1521 domain-containing protein [Sphingomonas sp. AP4-R1]QJU59882.1 DUF1521 domain-containing protein [Sphingomonas sp. AP4-R1]